MYPSFSQSQQASDVGSCRSMKLPNNPLLLPQTKKRVSFSPNARAKYTLHINNYSDDEILATWYTEDEMDSIRGEIRQTIEFMVAGELSCTRDNNNKTYCTRGLEFHSSPKRRQRRLWNKDASRDAVLDEQDLQDYQGIVDCEKIARAYRAVTCHCEAAASMMGIADEKAIAGQRRSFITPFGKTKSSSSQPTTQTKQLKKHNSSSPLTAVQKLRTS